MEVALRVRKLVFVTSILALFSAQTILPVMAGDDNRRERRYDREHDRRDGGHDRRDRGHDRRDWGHDRRGWGHERRDWAHDRWDDRHYKRHARDRDYRRHGDSVNLGIYLGGPSYYPRRNYYPEPYYPRRSYHGAGDHSLLGAIVGGGLGGVAGAQIGDGNGRTAAIIGGTIIGTLFGSNIGHTMRPYDYGYAANVFEETPSRQTVAWHNPDNGVMYEVTPTRTYQANGGQYCREYQARAVVGGRNADTYGTACRMPDGDWQIMN